MCGTLFIYRDQTVRYVVLRLHWAKRLAGADMAGPQREVIRKVATIERGALPRAFIAARRKT